jgi:hypothetical protein
MFAAMTRHFSTINKCVFSEHFPVLKEETSQYNKTLYNHLYKAFKTNEDLSKEFLDISKANAEKSSPDPSDIQKLSQIRQKLLDLSQQVKFFEDFK